MYSSALDKQHLLQFLALLTGQHYATWFINKLRANDEMRVSG